MFFRYFVCLAFLACTSALLAQHGLYDLSNYKARFERRPGLQISGRAGINGAYDKTSLPGNSFSISSNSFGFLNRNTDTLVATNSFTSNLRSSISSRNSSALPSAPSTASFYTAEFDLGTERLYYQPNRQKFWGWRGTLKATQEGNNTPNSFADSELAATPSLFRGLGRIEFAEDALLATWMMQDLRDAGVINTYSAEDLEFLARTITDIIGNRVFDNRRRRIYELKQLTQTLLESGLVEEESFDLFAVLNDNWAFANRATLRHGSLFRYGIQGAADGRIRRDTERDNQRIVNLSGGAFLEYQHHRIVAQNNGSHGYGGRFDILHFFEGSQIVGNDFDINREWWQARLSLFYRREWLPNSRSRLWLDNRLYISEWLSSNVGPDLIVDQELNQAFHRSTLSVDYFLNYNWTLRLSGSLNTRYLEAPSRLAFSHTFEVRTFYFIF
jgi:hypothetical protein